MLNRIISLFKKGNPHSKDYKILQSYRNYVEYLEHQKEKTLDPERRKKWLSEEWQPKLDYFQSIFSEVVEKFPTIKGGRGIGLGARTGQEVQAMINLGINATGVDLVACEPLVIEGDIHNLPFEDESFEFAFTNIFDHSLYPEKFLKEMDRVVKPGGVILIHLAFGDTDAYGVNEINNSKIITEYFKKYEIIEDEKMPTWGGLNHKVLINK